MRFAAIEYSSKSGKIWKHTPAHPNFLAEPHLEIDPTSFGCYVSALVGEHIPLTGLIVGDVYPLTEVVRLRRKIYKKILGRWPNDYSLEYLQKFDTLLIVHQISNGREITKFTKRLKEKFPDAVLVGVPTQPYGILKKYWSLHPWWFRDFRSFIDTCDVFITTVASTKEKFQELTTTSVEYLPQPYPVEYASTFFRQPESKERVLFVAGVTDRDNIQRGQVIARQLQHEFPDYTIHVTKIAGLDLDLHELKDARYSVMPFEPWRKHLSTLSKNMLVINTDFTSTRGRVQMDCAVVGTPSIGSNSDAQYDLFPSLAAMPDTLIDDLVQQGRQVLSNFEYYREIVAYARQKLPTYNYANTAARFQELVSRHRKN